MCDKIRSYDCVLLLGLLVITFLLPVRLADQQEDEGPRASFIDCVVACAGVLLWLQSQCEALRAASYAFCFLLLARCHGRWHIPMTVVILLARGRTCFVAGADASQPSDGCCTCRCSGSSWRKRPERPTTWIPLTMLVFRFWPSDDRDNHGRIAPQDAGRRWQRQGLRHSKRRLHHNRRRRFRHHRPHLRPHRRPHRRQRNKICRHLSTRGGRRRQQEAPPRRPGAPPPFDPWGHLSARVVLWLRLASYECDSCILWLRFVLKIVHHHSRLQAYCRSSLATVLMLVNFIINDTYVIPNHIFRINHY